MSLEPMTNDPKPSETALTKDAARYRRWRSVWFDKDGWDEESEAIYEAKTPEDMDGVLDEFIFADEMAAHAALSSSEEVSVTVSPDPREEES